MTAGEDIDVFCRAVQARSEEHRKAMDVALAQAWWAIAGSVLRMELDSLIRVIYLLRIPAVRDRILESVVAGKGFKAGKRIQDNEMITVAVADNGGWVKAVYDFGNKFVHLTDAHDYAEVDAFVAYEDRDEVISYLSTYHGGRLSGDSTMDDIVAYAPAVLSKITSNLNSYIKSLRAEVGQPVKPDRRT